MILYCSPYKVFLVTSIFTSTLRATYAASESVPASLYQYLLPTIVSSLSLSLSAQPTLYYSDSMTSTAAADLSFFFTIPIIVVHGVTLKLEINPRYVSILL